MGVLVGETWEDRMEYRKWSAHFTHVVGIAGQSEYEAQFVALLGGYEDDEDHEDHGDDEDHSEWFLYTIKGTICIIANVPLPTKTLANIKTMDTDVMVLHHFQPTITKLTDSAHQPGTHHQLDKIRRVDPRFPVLAKINPVVLQHLNRVQSVRVT
ncbi:Uncharacterized protein Fot_12867 [Forsythia ovata]|uniref:YDG domain-containing protein n=1 Tax=Forsythia ovata TaxID=205694 RepID=A0ABD1W1W7_9LAMI